MASQGAASGLDSVGGIRACNRSTVKRRIVAVVAYLAVLRRRLASSSLCACRCSRWKPMIANGLGEAEPECAAKPGRPQPNCRVYRNHVTDSVATCCHLAWSRSAHYLPTCFNEANLLIR